MSVIVAHPDTQHSVHAARGLRRHGLLEYLFTSVSLQRPPGLRRALSTFAPAAYQRLSQHRSHEDFHPGELRVFPPHLLLSRLGERSWSMSQRLFGWLAAQRAVRHGCAVLAFNTNAVETFRVLNRAGLAALLDQTIAHRRWSDRVGQAECDAMPEWQDSWAAPTWRAELEDEELERADLVLCGSGFCASTLEEQGVPRAKLAVVPYGAQTSVFTPRPPGERPGGPVRLLFVGSVTLRKGIAYLLEAALRLRGLVKLTLIGACRLNPAVLARYREVVEHRGFVLHGRMAELYREHDLYVFPSLVEGSSLSTYEALASGLPVITTPNSGSIVRDGVEGLIVPPRDVDALAAAIEGLARDPERREEMARAARLRAVTYGDWSHYGDRLAAAVAPVVRRTG